ncbi:unnamed protein product [Nesidiocoris tenuis]|uniref:Uncharacterized protein n=1 Tax=Nesidiocoris tenuis TaxID=355587 RepID=A0A6H5GMR6_9HEMI|nr:unnamed protein product [Nesidiocoris tenuis]
MNESLNRTNAHAPNSDVLKELFEDNVLTSAPHVPTQGKSNGSTTTTRFSTLSERRSRETRSGLAKAPECSTFTPPSATVDSSETADNGASANPSSEASDLQNSKDDDLLLNISSWDVSSVSDVSEVKERTDNPSPSLRLTGSNSSTPFHSKAGSSATEKSVLPLGDISLSIESIRPMLPSKAHGAFQHRIARPQSVSARRGDNSNHADRFADQGQESSTFLIRCEMRVSNAKFVFQEPILLKYVISYTTDEETITEMGQIDTLPMTED